MGHFEGQVCILLHKENGGVIFSVYLPYDFENLLDYKGCKSQGGLIHQQEHRPGHQCPRNGEHLLFTPTECAAGLMAPFCKNRKKLEYVLHILLDAIFVSAQKSTHVQVFHHG